MAALLLAAGGGIGWHAYESLTTALASHQAAVGVGHLHPEMMHPAAIAVALASIVSKELLFRATMKVAARTNSSLLVANAWHHRSDALSSVVALSPCISMFA